ncbi:hypothetical protein OS493_011262 [Desmophyllum pertusum]|uniref:Uncharacterized protein n=1 Tax=Desmophyllum pertusum TaxID=174260 RepID=A0A9W9Z1J8_9CNID|nr:hypothetical protein OS493_011262 [Desmophyllum pertusum]
MTSCGHLELEVDIEFVDLPGLGAGGDTEASKAELSNADLVLFFQCGQSGRPVTPLDPSTLILPSLLNYKSSTVIPPDLSLLHKTKKEELLDAWKPFFKTEKEGDNEGTADYRNAATAKLPHLGGEELLERLRDECEVLIFHPDLTTFLQSLCEAITSHVEKVKVKRQIHPVLKSIYPVAKHLKRQTSLTATLASKKKSGVRKRVEAIPSPSFELCYDMMDAEDLVESFSLHVKRALVDDDIANVFRVLYNKFLYSLDTNSYLLDMLQLSLEHFSTKLKACLEITQTQKFPEVSNAFQLLLDPSNTEVTRLLPQAKKCLFAYQRSQVRCEVVEDMSCPGDEIIVKKSVVGQKVFLEAAMSKQMHKTTQQISTCSRDITSQIAPVFIPVQHPGPSQEMTGNFFLQDDPWAKDMDGREQDEASAEKTVEEEVKI